jgi:RNA polymerase primary sigma factor
MKTMRESYESLQSYLEQMSRFPRLTPNEEIAAAKRLTDSRRWLRTCILSCDFVLQRVLRLLERLQQRELRLDHTIGFSSNDAGERQRVSMLLPEAIDELRRILRGNRGDFAQVVDGSLAMDIRRAAWRRMAARRRRGVRLVEDIGVRTRHLQRWQRQLESLGVQMLRLSRKVAAARLNAGEELASVRRALRGLMRRTLHSPATLRRHLDCCRRHEREYEDVKHFLVSSNLRLVVAIAKRYRHRGVGFLDLIQEGNAGLLQAVDRWDPQGGKFATYATWWARQAIKEAVHMQSRTIRLPEQVVDRLRRIHGAARSLVHQHGFRPNVEAIARQAGMTAEQAERMLQIHREPFSLDQPLDEESKAAMGDFLIDHRRNGFVEDLTREQLKARLADVMTDLNERQRAVISLRYGLLDGSQRTLDEVGKLLSLTREGVRQIELRAVERLRHPTRSRLLRGFLDSESDSNSNVARRHQAN